MFTDAHTPDNRGQKELSAAPLAEELLHAPNISQADMFATDDLRELGKAFPKNELLLPVPDPEDVAGFITLYRTQYDIELQPEQAHEILGGLMRFLYLTRRRTKKQQMHSERPTHNEI